jgi:putative zinc finger/helix-turn-helix YgiT family protein
MRLFCGNCEEFHETTVTKEWREFQIKDTAVSGKVTVLTCVHCGSEVYDKKNAIANDIILFDDYKRKNKLLTSTDIKLIRDKYNLTQEALAKILGFGLKTITRYENGSIQDITHDNLLKLLFVENNFIMLWKEMENELTEKENLNIRKSFTGKTDIPMNYQIKGWTSNMYETKNLNGGLSYEGC